MLQFLTSAKALTFIGGTIVGAAASPILKSKTTRKVAVSAIAKGYQLKNTAEAQWASIREDACDLYAEAVTKAMDENEILHSEPEDEANSDDFQ